MFTVVDGVLLKPAAALSRSRSDRGAVPPVFTNQGRATIPRVAGGRLRRHSRADNSAFESIASYYGGEMGRAGAGSRGVRRAQSW
jgi:hypothetical protein